jgi:hypothetical protein
MAWEKRRSPRGRFFYRAERRDDKVVKTYVGPQTSPVVEFISRLDRNIRALTRLNHSAERADDEAERDRLMRAFDIRSKLIMKIFRKKGTMNRPSSQTKTASDATSKGPVNNNLPTQAEFFALVNRAEKGSEKAQAELRNLLDLNSELWRPLGDIGNIVEGFLVDLAGQRSFLMRESLQRRLAEVRDQLMNGEKGPLLGFLVHRVLVSWLEVEVRQIQAMLAQGEPANRKLQRRLDQAQRRHGESVTALRDFQYFPFDSESGITPAAPFTDPTDRKPPTPTPAHP